MATNQIDKLIAENACDKPAVPLKHGDIRENRYPLKGMQQQVKQDLTLLNNCNQADMQMFVRGQSDDLSYELYGFGVRHTVNWSREGDTYTRMWVTSTDK